MNSGFPRSLALGYLLALGAAVSYGGSQVVAKKIVEDVPPLVGAAFALFFGTIILGVLVARDVSHSNPAPKKAYFWAGLAGLFASSGVAAMFLALDAAPVVVVAPVISINPLFAILLSQIFIRRLERISWRLVAGAVMIAVGVSVITISRI